MLKHTIPLVSGRWTAEIAPDRGANPIRVQYGGEDILIPWTAEDENPFLIGSPLLLPANRTAGGRFSFHGTEYTLPISDSFHCANLHGSLYLHRFQVTEQSPSCVGLHFENQGEIFPFAFVIRVRYHIEDSSFVSEYVIENPADTPMPFTFALHTTFRDAGWFQVPLAACQEKDCRHIPTGRYIPLSPRERGCCECARSTGVPFSGYFRAAGDTARIGPHIRYHVEGFDHWVLYNGCGTGGFLCVEPQLGAVNALNDEQNCPILPPKGHIFLKTRISICK